MVFSWQSGGRGDLSTTGRPGGHSSGMRKRYQAYERDNRITADQNTNTLARNCWVLGLRGVADILFSSVAFVWPRGAANKPRQDRAAGSGRYIAGWRA
jgi:hypothetical protein